MHYLTQWPSAWLLVLGLCAGLIPQQTQAQAPAQADTAAYGLRQFRFNLSMGFCYQAALMGGDNRARYLRPGYLAVRRALEPDVANQWGLAGNQNVTDNPQGHAPTYAELQAQYRPAQGLELYASFTADHRGFSFGPYNTYALVFFPRYYADYRRHFAIGKSDTSTAAADWYVRVKVGTFQEAELYERLTVYNLDYQAIAGEIRWRHWGLAASNIGDMWNMVGLNINGIVDYHALMLGLPLGAGDNPWKLDVRAGLSNYILEDFQARPRVVNLSAAVYPHDSLRLYGQFSYRTGTPDSVTAPNWAAVLGVHHRYKHPRWQLETRAELRYYGGGFNHALNDETRVHYRRTDRGTLGNYIGDQLYPLSFFGRPFSQWNVFTEYTTVQYVAGASAYAHLRYQIKGGWHLLATLDVNALAAQGQPLFVYPLYHVGVAYMPLPDTYMSVGLTNRTMNLDKHYTTYYALQYPAFQIELSRRIDWGRHRSG